jgi:hypothetical protein
VTGRIGLNRLFNESRECTCGVVVGVGVIEGRGCGWGNGGEWKECEGGQEGEWVGLSYLLS